jgi:N-acetyl-anhydromuramyl-L-alanine amidase AmpD
MRLLTCNIICQTDTKNINTKSGSTMTVFVFKAFETDLDGARVPCFLETTDKKVAAHLAEQSPDIPLYVPFNRVNEYGGKDQFSVDPAILDNRLSF